MYLTSILNNTLSHAMQFYSLFFFLNLVKSQTSSSSDDESCTLSPASSATKSNIDDDDGILSDNMEKERQQTKPKQKKALRTSKLIDNDQETIFAPFKDLKTDLIEKALGDLEQDETTVQGVERQTLVDNEQTR